MILIFEELAQVLMGILIAALSLAGIAVLAFGAYFNQVEIKCHIRSVVSELQAEETSVLEPGNLTMWLGIIAGIPLLFFAIYVAAVNWEGFPPGFWHELKLCGYWLLAVLAVIGTGWGIIILAKNMSWAILRRIAYFLTIVWFFFFLSKTSYDLSMTLTNSYLSQNKDTPIEILRANYPVVPRLAAKYTSQWMIVDYFLPAFSVLGFSLTAIFIFFSIKPEH